MIETETVVIGATIAITETLETGGTHIDEKTEIGDAMIATVADLIPPEAEEGEVAEVTMIAMGIRAVTETESALRLRHDRHAKLDNYDATPSLSSFLCTIFFFYTK